jgi:hypothetical protein
MIIARRHEQFSHLSSFGLALETYIERAHMGT